MYIIDHCLRRPTNQSGHRQHPPHRPARPRRRRPRPPWRPSTPTWSWWVRWSITCASPGDGRTTPLWTVTPYIIDSMSTSFHLQEDHSYDVTSPSNFEHFLGRLQSGGIKAEGGAPVDLVCTFVSMKSTGRLEILNRTPTTPPTCLLTYRHPFLPTGAELRRQLRGAHGREPGVQRAGPPVDGVGRVRGRRLGTHPDPAPGADG